MKPGESTLNTNAAAYVPLSKREGYQGQRLENSLGPLMSKTTRSSDTKTSDEDLEKDTNLEFLLFTFSELSYASISAVYLANNFDMDETMEMLNVLEGNIPDTLDIGYVPETIEPATVVAASNNKNASNEVSSSSSSSSDVPKTSVSS